jgi:hypothetical protein
MEYRWSPESKFARAALADTYFPDFEGIDGEALSTEGDTDHWETRAILSKPGSIPAILDLLGKKIVADTPRRQGPVTLVSSDSTRSNNKSEMTWKFTDEQGHNWSGQGIVEKADGQPGKFLVTLKLIREKKST